MNLSCNPVIAFCLDPIRQQDPDHNETVFEQGVENQLFKTSENVFFSLLWSEFGSSIIPEGCHFSDSSNRRLGLMTCIKVGRTMLQTDRQKAAAARRH